MTTPIPDLIAQGEALLTDATPGPWNSPTGDYIWSDDGLTQIASRDEDRDYAAASADINAIVWLRNNAPAIFAHIKAQDERIARLHSALRETNMTVWGDGQQTCDLCDQEWPANGPEAHAPGCLVQRQEPKP